MRSLNHLTCVIPAYNEAENLVHFVPALSAFLTAHVAAFDIVVVDDGSQDDTIAVLQPLLAQYPLKVLELSRNFGKEYALTAGLDHAHGDVVVLIDADFQHPIQTIAPMLDLWHTGYDMVYGVRNRQSESPLKRWLTRRFYWILNKGSRIQIPADAGDFRLLDRDVVHAIQQLPERTRYMKGLYAWVGFRSIGVVFEEATRQAGQTSFNFWKLSDLALLAITAFSDTPLRLCSLAGVILALFSMGYGAWIIFTTLVEGVHTPGFATLAVILTFLGGIQLLAIGVLGEYIANIYNEVKKRPNYIIAHTHDAATHTVTHDVSNTPTITKSI